MNKTLIIREEQDIKQALKAVDALLVLWDIDQHLRGEYKHNDNEAAYEIREKLHEIMADHGVDLEDLLE